MPGSDSDLGYDCSPERLWASIISSSAVQKILASIMMVLLLLAAATAVAGSVEQGIHPDIIMRLNLSQLTYPGGSAAGGMARRIWTKADLDRASSVLNYEQMWPVIKRLEAGLPITVLAYGDSITMAHAGCFHRDRYVKTRGQTTADGKASVPYTRILWRFFCSSGDQCGALPCKLPLFFRVHLSHYVDALSVAYTGPCHDQEGNGYLGWLNSFMHAINATFAHPGVGGTHVYSPGIMPSEVGRYSMYEGDHI